MDDPVYKLLSNYNSLYYTSYYIVAVPVPKDSGALVFPSNMGDIGESSRVEDYLVTLLSDELSNPLII
jgi:hypothetical protein